MRSVLITGASSGIGRATAEAFLAAGWCVGLLARREALLEEVAGGHSTAHVLPCDVTDPGTVGEALQAFSAKAGRLDCLFNNAGLFTAAAAPDEMPLDDWHRALDVNLNGMVYAARTAFGIMRRQDPQGGRIINNGSISAHVPREGALPYTVTKHAITGLTRQLALDGRPFGIACGQIDIGNARTEIVEGLAAAARAKGQPEPETMDVAHAARAVLAMADLPLEANVLFQTVMSTKMPYVGRG